METKPINTTDSPINNLNRPDTLDNSNNARWLGLNVLPQAPRNDFGPTNRNAATQVPAISARTASVTALAPYSTVEEKIDIFRLNYDNIKGDLEADKLASRLYSKFVIEREDMEKVKAAGPRFRQAEELMRIIQRYHDKADSNRKMVILFLVHYAMSQIHQGHLARLLNTKTLMPFERYPEAVKKEISDALTEKEVSALTAHLRRNNATACEHNDDTRQAYGTKLNFPIQESSGNNPW